MRARLARWIAVSTGLMIVLLAIAFALVQNMRQTAQTVTPYEPDVIETGRQVYMEQRCAACHGIAGEGNQRYPLDGVGDRLTETEIRKWLLSPREMNPDVRKPSYEHLSRNEFEGLLAYVMSLKAALDTTTYDTTGGVGRPQSVD